MEIIKEYKDGNIIRDKVEKIPATTIRELVDDSDIVAILIIKDGTIEPNRILSKNDKIKKHVSSVQYKDYINKKKEGTERTKLCENYKKGEVCKAKHFTP